MLETWIKHHQALCPLDVSYDKRKKLAMPEWCIYKEQKFEEWTLRDPN